jgi:hypothetical protein
MELPRGLESWPLKRTDLIGCRSHFAVSRSFSFVVFRFHWRAHRPEGLCSQTPTRLAFLQSIATVEPSRVPQPRGSSRGLSVPTTQVRFEGPLFDRIPLLSSFRLQGLATLLTVYSPQALVDLISDPPRPWDSPLRSIYLRQGIVALPPRWTHLLFLLRFLPRSKPSPGHASRSSWALTPAEGG